MERNVFALTDALTEGNKGEALRVLHFLLEGGHDEFALLGLICSHYETALAAGEMRGDGMNPAQMKSELDIHEFRIRKALNTANRYGAARLRKLLMSAYDVDRSIKTGVLDAETALELFVAGV